MQQNDRQRNGERGQTIVLAAIAMLSLLAMAALAIDVVTLYVARTEIQTAADAAALAAAKAVANSGITTLPSGDGYCNAAQTLAVSMANAAITAVLPNNLVAGSTPSQTGSPVFLPLLGGGISCPINNPHVTVTLQQTNLPTLFARIWGSNSISVQASATAEAYNPANPPAGSSYAFTPIAPTSVKPWLVANQDPRQPPNTPFVITTTGAVEDAIGEQFDLTVDCATSGFHHHHQCIWPLPDNPPTTHSFPAPSVDYLPAPPSLNTGNVCPPCSSGSDYERTISCADANPYSYFQVGNNNSAVAVTWDNGVNPGPSGTNDSADGAECLINATGGAGWDQGQDLLNNPIPFPASPAQITAGTANPLNGSLVSTSSSIVTIPIIDTSSPVPVSGQPLTIVGYLQAFINCVEDGTHQNCNQTGFSKSGDINVTVLNVVGGSNNPNANPPVVGGTGTSPIPVRLITPP